MAQEQRRGCGHRKRGATYLVGPIDGVMCHRLPISLHVCPTCGNGVKQSRGWTGLNLQRSLMIAKEWTLELGVHARRSTAQCANQNSLAVGLA